MEYYRNENKSIEKTWKKEDQDLRRYNNRHEWRVKQIKRARG